MRRVSKDTPDSWPNTHTRATYAWLTSLPSLRLAAHAVALEGGQDDAARAVRDWVEFELWPVVPRTWGGVATLAAVGSLRCVDWDWVTGALRR
jgi:hypothetical protein